MNTLISKISENLPQPSDFGVGSSEYIIWENEIDTLNKIPAEYKYDYTKNFLGAGGLIVGIIFLDLTDGLSFILVLWGFIWLVTGQVKNYTAEYEHVRTEISKLIDKKRELDDQYSSALRAKEEYVDDMLSQYKYTYLFRKRSSSYGFAEHLQIYSDAVEHFYHEFGSYQNPFDEHRKYVRSRDISVTPYEHRKRQNITRSRDTENKSSAQSSAIVQDTDKISIATEENEVVDSEQIDKSIIEARSFSSIPLQNTTSDILSQSESGNIFINKLSGKNACAIGRLGEEIALRHETQYLDSMNSSQVNNVEHVSITRGDGLGYDILSRFPNGKKKYIEVKTTTSSASVSPFTFTRNELAFLKQHPNNAFVYCVKNVHESPTLTIYPASAFSDNQFEAVEYKVSIV